MSNERIMELESFKERFELAIEGSHDGLWDWDILNHTVYFSPRWKKMLGYEDDELENVVETWRSRIHPEDREKTLENLQNYLTQKISKFKNIHRLRHKDGHWVWILDKGKGKFVDNRAVRMVGFHTDISKQKALELELAMQIRKEKEKNSQKDTMLRDQSSLAQMGEMISMIAHQWRQPLASIASISTTIKLKLALKKFDFSTKEGTEGFLQYLNTEIEDIENLIQVLTTTIDDFRDFYKIEKNITVKTIDIPIKKVLSILMPQFKMENIEIKSDFLSTKDTNIYENEIVQVFLNILKNSMDNFIEKKTPNPKIYIKTEDILGKVIVSICDNGGGIEEDILDLIFNPYFSTKKSKNGTGIGLYMSKMIIEQHHGGKISAHNKENGACFYVILEK